MSETTPQYCSWCDSFDKTCSACAQIDQSIPTFKEWSEKRIAELEQQLRRAQVDADRLNRLESHIENAHLRGTSTTFSGTGSASLRDLIDKMEPTNEPT